TIQLKQAENDIAVLRPDLPPDNLIPATLGNPNSLRPGDLAIVVGHPFGIQNSVTEGVISGTNRNFMSPNSGQVIQNVIQFDAAVNPGNSGGPLLNRYGEVMGIVTGLINPTDQGVFIGIGFAVPIQTAARGLGEPED
ncbi:MAG: trypsin-like peptidase domain-containing protein, partial [Chloroflexota bacterium]